jgi:ribosomal protein RSM22 (predicted rRNA methylase)
MNIRRWIRDWLLKQEERTLELRGNLPVMAETNAHSQPDAPHTRFGVLNVMNGKVLEVCTFKRNPHGPDWTTTYWILNEEQPLAEQLALVMTMKGLESK